MASHGKFINIISFNLETTLRADAVITPTLQRRNESSKKKCFSYLALRYTVHWEQGWIRVLVIPFSAACVDAQCQVLHGEVGLTVERRIRRPLSPLLGFPSVVVGNLSLGRPS